jgi:hypothetical protein
VFFEKSEKKRKKSEKKVKKSEKKPLFSFLPLTYDPKKTQKKHKKNTKKVKKHKKKKKKKTRKKCQKSAFFQKHPYTVIIFLSKKCQKR